MRQPLAVLILALLASCQTESEKITLLDSESAVARAEAGTAGTPQVVSSREAKALMEQQQDLVILDVRPPKSTPPDT